MGDDPIPSDTLPVSVGFMAGLDYVVGILPALAVLAYWPVVLDDAMESSSSLGQYAVVVFGLLIWSGTGLWRTASRWRKRARLRALRRSIVYRLITLLLLHALIGYAVLGGIQVLLPVTLGLIGPSYVSVRHLLLIYLDVQKERVHGGCSDEG